MNDSVHHLDALERIVEQAGEFTEFAGVPDIGQGGGQLHGVGIEKP